MWHQIQCECSFSIHHHFFSTPDFKVAEGGLYVLRMFFILKYFSDFCQTNQLSQYPPNRSLRNLQAGMLEPLAVDKGSKVIFSIPRGTLPWQPIFC